MLTVSGDHSYRGRGGNPRSSYGPKNYQNHYDNQHSEHFNEYPKILAKGPLSPVDDRTVIATDKSIKVTVNQGATPVKGPVMSVKGDQSTFNDTICNLSIKANKVPRGKVVFANNITIP